MTLEKLSDKDMYTITHLRKICFNEDGNIVNFKVYNLLQGYIDICRLQNKDVRDYLEMER